MPLFSKGSYPQALQASYQYSAKSGLFTPLRATDQKQKVIGVPLHLSAPKSYIRIGTACTKFMGAQNVALAPELREPTSLLPHRLSYYLLL